MSAVIQPHNAEILSEETETKYRVESQAIGEAPHWYTDITFKELEPARAFIKEHGPHYSTRKWRIVEVVKSTRYTIL